MTFLYGSSFKALSIAVSTLTVLMHLSLPLTVKCYSIVWSHSQLIFKDDSDNDNDNNSENYRVFLLHLSCHFHTLVLIHLIVTEAVQGNSNHQFKLLSMVAVVGWYVCPSTDGLLQCRILRSSDCYHWMLRHQLVIWSVTFVTCVLPILVVWMSVITRDIHSLTSYRWENTAVVQSCHIVIPFTEHV